MKSKSLKIKRLIDTEIKKGDTVRLIDGSGLTHISIEQPFYIVRPYPEVTGEDKELEIIEAKVIETNITDYVTEGVCNNCYLQDIIIKVGNAKFRTYSKSVAKKGTPRFDFNPKPYFI